MHLKNMQTGTPYGTLLNWQTKGVAIIIWHRRLQKPQAFRLTGWREYRLPLLILRKKHCREKGCDTMRILVVEDDHFLNNTLSYNLSAVGYSVDGAMSKADATRFLEKQDYDLIVLDVNLPDGNGFDICREIKERRPDTAVIFLTANDMESDMLKGFELGADDYVTKPFPISVFQRKVSALLNRISAQSGGDFYDDGNLYINFSELSACLAGQPITLTPLEYRLLKVLIKNSQTVLTRQVLLEKLWDVDENYVDEHALTTTVSRIRSKIETNRHSYIKTVYGMGYMWIGGMQK